MGCGLCKLTGFNLIALSELKNLQDNLHKMNEYIFLCSFFLFGHKTGQERAGLGNDFVKIYRKLVKKCEGHPLSLPYLSTINKLAMNHDKI